MVDDELQCAIEELRFDDAHALIAGLDEDARAEAARRVEAAQVRAVDEGEDLAGRIQELARNDHYPALLAVGSDPRTDLLLACVSEEIRRGARVHLDGAVRRRDIARSAARKHLDATRAALDGYDPAAARKHLDKIDTGFLTSEAIDELTDLRARYVAVNAETRELSAATADIIAEVAPPPTRGGRGCIGTSLLIVGALAVALTRFR